MLDIKYVREHLEEVIERLNTRNGDYSYLREIPVLDEKRRALIKEGDELKAGETIGKLAAPSTAYTEEGCNLYFKVEQNGTAVDPLLLLD